MLVVNARISGLDGDARYSSDSVGDTSAARTSESAGPEKWKDEDLGWFPKLTVQARVA